MSVEARLAVAEEKLTSGDERMDRIESKLDVLIEAQHKQRGFIAGFSAAFSLLATAVVGLGVYIFTHLTGKP